MAGNSDAEASQWHASKLSSISISRGQDCQRAPFITHNVSQEKRIIHAIQATCPSEQHTINLPSHRYCKHNALAFRKDTRACTCMQDNLPPSAQLQRSSLHNNNASSTHCLQQDRSAGSSSSWDSLYYAQWCPQNLTRRVPSSHCPLPSSPQRTRPAAKLEHIERTRIR